MSVTAVKLPTIYLAGAIRNHRDDDIEWREEVMDQLLGMATFLNPLAGKVFDPKTEEWTIYNGTPSAARYIVKKDFWCVDRADIVIFNLNCLVEGYPTIGTLCEFGRSTGTGALIYTIIDPNYTGHEHGASYKLHPFIEENSAMVFQDVASCVNFLEGELRVSSGLDPHYWGVLEKGGKV